jgi:hypothetical protein
VSRVKRYLEDQTDRVLDSVRLYGSAIISEGWESDRYGWGGGPYALLSRTLETLAREWLTSPSAGALGRLEAATAALSQIPQQTVTVPPLEEADALSNWREALEDAVEEAVELLEELLSPYGLALQWETVGLCAVPVDTEWATAHSEGVWRGARQ